MWSRTSVPHIYVFFQSRRLSLHTSQVAHQAGAYAGFDNMKRLGVFLPPLDGKLVQRRVTHSVNFAMVPSDQRLEEKNTHAIQFCRNSKCRKIILGHWVTYCSFTTQIYFDRNDPSFTRTMFISASTKVVSRKSSGSVYHVRMHLRLIMKYLCTNISWFR